MQPYAVLAPLVILSATEAVVSMLNVQVLRARSRAKGASVPLRPHLPVKPGRLVLSTVATATLIAPD
jgi:hypothetical protein